MYTCKYFEESEEVTDGEGVFCIAFVRNIKGLSEGGKECHDILVTDDFSTVDEVNIILVAQISERAVHI